MKQVPVGQLAEEGEYHAMLDSAENFDADTVAGSNDLYDFAGMDTRQPELLLTRVLPCICVACRNETSVHTEYTGCKYMSTCGQWKQQTVHTAQVPCPRSCPFKCPTSDSCASSCAGHHEEKGHEDGRSSEICKRAPEQESAAREDRCALCGI